jgi:hypothetical protein
MALTILFRIGVLLAGGIVVGGGLSLILAALVGWFIPLPPDFDEEIW